MEIGLCAQDGIHPEVWKSKSRRDTYVHAHTHVWRERIVQGSPICFLQNKAQLLYFYSTKVTNLPGVNAQLKCSFPHNESIKVSKIKSA